MSSSGKGLQANERAPPHHETGSFDGSSGLQARRPSGSTPADATPPFERRTGDRSRSAPDRNPVRSDRPYHVPHRDRRKTQYTPRREVGSSPPAILPVFPEQTGPDLWGPPQPFAQCLLGSFDVPTSSRGPWPLGVPACSAIVGY